MTHNTFGQYRYGYGQPGPHPQSFPRIPQSLQGPGSWPAPTTTAAAPYPPAAARATVAPREAAFSPAATTPATAAPYAHLRPQPVFRVCVTKHTGLALAFLNEKYAFTGTLAQCEAVIRDAQRHNLVAGWWSMASLLIWNWVALHQNHTARNLLRRQAAMTGIADTPAL